MRYYLFPFFIVLTFSLSAQNVKKGPKPKWVSEVQMPKQKNLDGNSGFQYLLIDKQDNVSSQEFYRHFAVRILNSDGVQGMSDLSSAFDPAYQKLTFHDVKIHRGNQVIEKLAKQEIKTFQRETNMERALYDGSLTAVINLSDVRVDDIIEYSFTIQGFNPIYEGNYSQTFYHQFTIPINRVFSRVLVSPEKDIKFKVFNSAGQPEMGKMQGLREYLWDIEALDFKVYDNNIPSWFDAHAKVSVTTFNNWKEVVDIALPLYRYDPDELAHVEELSSTDPNAGEQKILELIREVQDGVRYLGFESGTGGYKPNPPLKVFQQKYGDCKDKSLLLIALLRKEGIEASPLLVNTQLQGEIASQLPGLDVFNHCVVNFTFNGKNYFVDPTLSNQGGNLGNLYFPNYKKGLLIKEGVSTLNELPTPLPATVKVKEIISMNSIGSSAKMIVRTEYTGSKANYIRGYFSSNSMEAIQKEYLNFYSSIYSGIESQDKVKIYDYDRNSKNLLITEEYYRINDAWQTVTDESHIYFETYPLVLEGQTNYTKSAMRDMPYYMGEPYSFEQTTDIDLPEEWYVEDSKKEIIGNGFRYENTVRSFGKKRTVQVTHKYALSKEYILGAEVETMLKKHNEIRNEFAYYLTKSETADAAFKLSWISLLLTTIGLAIGLSFAVKVYNSYDPEAWEFAENKSIGSWLIIPAIGITINPLITAYQFFSEDYFDHKIWNSTFSSGFEGTGSIGLVLAVEILYNSLFLIFSLLVLVQFYQRRTSVPRLVTIYFIVGFVGPLFDMLVVESIMPGMGFDGDAPKDLMKSFVSAAIWVPYFNVAERVKSTFCIRLDAD